MNRLAGARYALPMPRVLAGIHPGIAAVTVLYMLIFGGLALRQGNTEFIFYTVAMLVFIAGVLGLHARVRFSTLSLGLLSAWGLLHMAGGTVPIPADLAQTEAKRTVLYSLRLHPDLPRYDQVTHAFGFFAATIAAWEALRAGIARFTPATVVPSPGLALAAALIGMGLGALNEVVEFTATLVVAEHNVGGYVNTGWDLVSNTVGAVAGAALLLTRRPTAPTAPSATGPAGG